MEKDTVNCFDVLKEEVTEETTWIEDSSLNNKSEGELIMSERDDDCYGRLNEEDIEEKKYPIEELITGEGVHVMETETLEDCVKKSEANFRKKPPEMQSKRYECTKCRKTFTKPEFYQRHLLTHRNRVPFACEFCSSRFKSVVCLQFHHVKVHKKDPKPFKCFRCDKTFTMKIELKGHIQVERGLTRLEVNKEDDLQVFGDIEEVGNNKEKITYRIFKCDICFKGFQRKYNLERHMKVHQKKKHAKKVDLKAKEGTQEKKYACELCNLKFNGEIQLQNHLNEGVHLEMANGKVVKKSLKCSYCEKTFTRNFNRERHELSHTHGRLMKKPLPSLTVTIVPKAKHPWKCNYCKRTFITKTWLEEHKKVHMKTYQQKSKCKSESEVSAKLYCKPCERRFKSELHFKRHLNADAHLFNTGDESRKCEYCGKMFQRKFNLERHRLSHIRGTLIVKETERNLTENENTSLSNGNDDNEVKLEEQDARNVEDYGEDDGEESEDTILGLPWNSENDL